MILVELLSQFHLACVAGVRKGGEFGCETAREGLKGGGDDSFSFPLHAFRASRAPGISFPFPFKRLPRRLHALCLHCWLTWIFDILILDRLSTITAMPCWWAPIRAKQLSMTATARVIWLCACVRYWQEPITGTGQAVGWCVPLALNLSHNGWAGKYLLTIAVQSKPQPHLKDSFSNQQQQQSLLLNV